MKFLKCKKANSLIIGLIAILISIPIVCLADQEEVGLGNFMDQQIVAKNLLLMDEKLTQSITEIGNRIVSASGEADVKYTFRIIHDYCPNAYATSGGFIYITTGILDISESSDELAAVLAHEIAHVKNKDRVEEILKKYQIKRNNYINGFLIGSLSMVLVAGAYAAMGRAIENTVDSKMSDYQRSDWEQKQKSAMEKSFRTAMQISELRSEFEINGFRKEQENKADLSAQEYLRKAGYDPSALINMKKKKMNQNSCQDMKLE